MEDQPIDMPADAATGLGPHITDSPLFIIGVVILVIIIAIILRRFVFDNTHPEYKYKNEED